LDIIGETVPLSVVPRPNFTPSQKKKKKKKNKKKKKQKQKLFTRACPKNNFSLRGKTKTLLAKGEIFRPRMAGLINFFK